MLAALTDGQRWDGHRNSYSGAPVNFPASVSVFCSTRPSGRFPSLDHVAGHENNAGTAIFASQLGLRAATSGPHIHSLGDRGAELTDVTATAPMLSSCLRSAYLSPYPQNDFTEEIYCLPDNSSFHAMLSRVQKASRGVSQIPGGVRSTRTAQRIRATRRTDFSLLPPSNMLACWYSPTVCPSARTKQPRRRRSRAGCRSASSAACSGSGARLQAEG